MNADLFSALEVREPPVPKREPAVAFTGRFVADSGGVHFTHPCGLCGHAVAPFGYGVRLRAAMNAKDAKRAGRWLCTGCRDLQGDLP